MTEILLPFLFLVVSFLYSSVGLGGGSSYTALMTIFGISHQVIPATSLLLNMVVTFIGMINFWRNSHGKISLILPFLVTSIPLTYLSATWLLSKTIFETLLLVTLIFVVIRIYFLNELKLKIELKGAMKWITIFGLGGILGIVAGAVGIGGGIYLVPLIVIFGFGSEKEAAAAGTVFIWINSFVGILPRLNKNVFEINFLIPLVLAVIVGGFAGSYFGSYKLKRETIQRNMGMILIIAILFLAKDLLL